MRSVSCCRGVAFAAQWRHYVADALKYLGEDLCCTLAAFCCVGASYIAMRRVYLIACRVHLSSAMAHLSTPGVRLSTSSVHQTTSRVHLGTFMRLGVSVVVFSASMAAERRDARIGASYDRVCPAICRECCAPGVAEAAF